MSSRGSATGAANAAPVGGIHVEHDRRTFLKKSATVAWATPLILTLGATRAGAQAASCLPTGTGCGIFFNDPINGPSCAASPVAGLFCCTACVPVGGICRCA
jgi:hypothetical protein